MRAQSKPKQYKSKFEILVMSGQENSQASSFSAPVGAKFVAHAFKNSSANVSE